MFLYFGKENFVDFFGVCEKMMFGVVIKYNVFDNLNSLIKILRVLDYYCCIKILKYNGLR